MTKCRKRIVGKASRPSDSARLGLETSLATLDNSIGFPFKSIMSDPYLLSLCWSCKVYVTTNEMVQN